MNREATAYLSIGSNMGNRLYYLVSALKELENTNGIKISKISSFYETAPWGVKNQENFLNIVVEVGTTLLPFLLLRKLQEIEKSLDRVRKEKWGPRTLDIDIIFYDDLNINTKDLIIPHPYYQRRSFVLKPLCEIYPHREQLLKYCRKDLEEVIEIVPSILVSSCLLGLNCNYKGGNSTNRLLKILENRVEYVSVCPEVLGGLTVPRVPAEIKGDKVVTKNGADVSLEFLKGAHHSLERAVSKSCVLAVMKSKSPSCGKEFIYDGTFSGKLTHGNGVTVDLFIKNGIDVISV